MMKNSDYARLITAAHRGSQLCQQALDAIDATRLALAKACDDNHIIRPSDHGRVQICETVATYLLAASPWLKGVADSQGVDTRH